MQSRQGDDPGGLAGDGERSVSVVEQEDGGLNPTRRAVVGHTGDTVDEPGKSTPQEVDGRVAYVRADTVKVVKWTQPNLYIGGVEVTELAERLEATAKALTDMAEALRGIGRTRRSM